MNENAELQNGRWAMIGFDIALLNYVFTGQIIPGVFQNYGIESFQVYKAIFQGPINYLANFFEFLKMGIGKLFLASILTGIITQEELEWMASNQLNFSRIEKATALKLGQLVDLGQLQLGFRA